MNYAQSSALGANGRMPGLERQEYKTQACDAIAPRTTVTSQIEALNGELANLFSAVDRVGERTSYICEAAPPETVASAQSSIEPPVIEALASIIERIQLATSRLHGLADRVRI